MLNLDHLTIIAPTLLEGVRHVEDCIDIAVPFGTRHFYMGTYNHRLQLGENVYLEIVALDPDGIDPGRARWFGVDDPVRVRQDWEEKRRLKGWVAATTSIESVVGKHSEFGEVVPLPLSEPEFAFSIPADGSLPMDGVLPSLIDHWGNPTRMSEIPDLGARLSTFVLFHPEPEEVELLYRELTVNRPPEVRKGRTLHYEATIETSNGMRELW